MVASPLRLRVKSATEPDVVETVILKAVSAPAVPVGVILRRRSILVGVNPNKDANVTLVVTVVTISE